MKACVLEAIGQLNYEERPEPEPKQNEVLLEIKRCGICSSDIDRVFKTGTYHFPTIPGHEISGKISALGQGVDERYLNRKAAVFPLLPCFRCSSCQREEYARCNSYSYFGSRCDGGFAEYLAVPVWNVVLAPEQLSYDAIALCEPAAVALHAVNAAKVSQNDTVMLIGCGTIGLLAGLWAQAHGAGRVMMVGRGKTGLKMAQNLGLTETISVLEKTPEEIRLLTDGGADIVLEMAGNADSVCTAIQCAKKGGTIVVTGNPTSDITMPRNLYWSILRNELTIRGTWNSSYNSVINEWDTTLQAMEKGVLQAAEQIVTHKFPLTGAKDAFDTLLDKTSGAIKVMFQMNE